VRKKEVNKKYMDDKRRLRILRSALETISLEAKEPIIRVYAQSALDETVDDPIEKPIPNSYCEKHNWFGLALEKCPLCCKLPNKQMPVK
jgi:hypothetical protein